MFYSCLVESGGVRLRAWVEKKRAFVDEYIILYDCDNRSIGTWKIKEVETQIGISRKQVIESKMYDSTMFSSI